MNGLLFIILCFANWRISSIIAAEEGPFDLFGRFRNWAGVRYNEKNEPFGTNNFARGLICVWCVSVWVGFLMGLGLALFLPDNIGVLDIMAIPFALSTGAIVIDTAVNR